MDGSGTLFNGFTRALDTDIKVKIVRYPPIEPLGYQELEAIACAAVPKYGPIILLGESFSGPIAISLASTLASRLKGLILCCSFVCNPHPYTAHLKPIIPLLPIYPKLPNFLSRYLLGQFSTDALRHSLTQSIKGLSSAAIRARLGAVIDVDVSAKLASLEVPVLYLRASEDRLVPRSASKIVQQAKPDTHIIDVEAPHFLLQTAPVEAARYVSAFIHEIHAMPSNKNP
jgi:pimeloyl-ACP methyl ester carboxylesterase